MCTFFSKKNFFKGMAAGNIIFPLVLTIYFYQQDKSELGLTCVAWLFGATASVRSGYVVGVMQPCPLPHLAEDVEVEGQQRNSISLRNL